MEKRQTGRSMLEMLMTLAIIGVLSCVAVWGLSMSFTKHKANTLIEDVKMAGFIVVDEMFKNMVENEEISMAGHFIKSSGYEFSAFKEPGVGGLSSASFAIVADNVPYKVCIEVQKRKMDWLEIIMPNGRVNKCYENDQNSISFFFNTQLNTEETKERECETNADCGTETPFCCAGLCQVNEECECPGGDWRKVTNYASDGSESVLGEMCCKTGYNSAVDGMCCDASKPYCKEVAYLESTGRQSINTEVNAVSTIKWFVDAQKTKVNDKNTDLAGVGDEDNIDTRMYVHFSSTDGNVVLRIGSTIVNIKNSNNVNRFSVVLDLLNKKGYFNGSLVINASEEDTANATIPIALFCRNTGGHYTHCTSSRIYNFKLWNNEVLTLDFIPVIDNDGKAGMYDKVSDEMFYNSGTGKFIAGE